MSRLSTIAAMCLLGSSLCAQVQLDRQVISPAGGDGSGSFLLSYTAGQPEFRTGVGQNASLTQGFQQPGFKDPLLVVLLIEQPTCDNDSLGSVLIDQMSGCATEPVEVLLNGSPAELPLTGLQTGSYLIEISAGFNCRFSQEFSLSFDDSGCGLAFYNLITPNNDGQNDVWFIEGIEQDIFRSNAVQIFNRWGQLVWEGSDYDNVNVVWVGEDLDNRELPQGTYFYEADLNGKVFNGYIELLR